MVATETSLLITELKKSHELNEIILYKKLEQVVSGSTTTCRHYLTSAMNIVKRDYGYLFKCVPTVGYRPLPNWHKVDEIERIRIAKIKSQVDKFDWELSTVDIGSLTRSQKQKLSTAQVKVSIHQSILADSMEDTYKKIGSQCANSRRSQPVLSPDDVRDAIAALF